MVFYVLYTSDAQEGLTYWLLSHAQTQVITHFGNFWLLQFNISDLKAK
jgi:hypothetical protein